RRGSLPSLRGLPALDGGASVPGRVGRETTRKRLGATGQRPAKLSSPGVLLPVRVCDPVLSGRHPDARAERELGVRHRRRLYWGGGGWRWWGWRLESSEIHPARLVDNWRQHLDKRRWGNRYEGSPHRAGSLGRRALRSDADPRLLPRNLAL